MRIELITGCDVSETEITVRCREADAELRSLLALLNAQDKRLAARKDGETHMLEPRDILYADTADKRTFLYTSSEVYETTLRLYELEERLRRRGFVRAGKSQLVNLDRVRSIRPEFNGRLLLTMQNGEKLLVSRQYAAEIKQILEVDK